MNRIKDTEHLYHVYILMWEIFENWLLMFLTQRVKSSQTDYSERLIKHHDVILAAMKVKQNSDMKYAVALKMSIEKLVSYYPEQKLH